MVYRNISILGFRATPLSCGDFDTLVYRNLSILKGREPEWYIPKLSMANCLKWGEIIMGI